jgi:hypothetical protein
MNNTNQFEFNNLIAKHFSEDEILSYTKNKFLPQQRFNMARHFGKCKQCGMLLFQIAPFFHQEQFQNYLNSDDKDVN